MTVKHRFLILLSCIMLALILFVVTELLIVKYNGSFVPAPMVPRSKQVLGVGPQLTYVVMGDSTSIGQGADYNSSYAVASADHLAKDHQVTFANVGVSGAVVKDVLNTQLAQAINYKPDIVVLAVGANDATHFTGGSSIQVSLQKIVDGLRAANCKVRIVVTGSPAMDSVNRFPWPIRQLMGLRTRQVNNVFSFMVARNKLILAPIALKTRDTFIADPTLLAADKFHPNARGYALWTPVINQALDVALNTHAPESCKQ